MLKMTLSRPKSPPAELQLEGVIQELRRDKKMYQKTAMLQLRSVPLILLKNLFVQLNFIIALILF